MWAILAGASLIAASCSGSSDGGGAEGTDPPASEPVATEPVATEAAADEPAEPADEPDAAPASTIPPLEDEDQITSEGEGRDVGDLEPVQGGEITFGLTNDGTGFDTTAAVAPGSIRVITAMNDSLVGLTATADWAPNLAESLTPNDDFTVWTITMRPDLTFHDGAPVDAAAVAANLEAFRTSPTVGFAFAPVVSIIAVDELSVEVTMSAPWATFPFGLVGQAGWMVSPSTIGMNDVFVGTGPYMLENWTPGDGARVVANPNYWRAAEGLPYLDAINFKFLVDQTVKRQAFEAGDVDGYIGPGDEDILDFLDDDDIDVWIGTAGANEYGIILNTLGPPFDDIRVRRALALATDRQFLIDAFRSGLTIPADGPLNPSSRWYTKADYPAHDLAAAKLLVDEYEAEVGPIVFEVSSEPNATFIEILEVLISFWEDAGIEASVKEIGLGQSAITAILDDFQAFNWIQFGPPDPDGLYTFFHSSGGVLNWSNLVSDKIDRGLDMGRQSDDEATRLAGYALFLEGLAEDVPIVWIDHLNGVEAAVTSPKLHGIGTEGMLPDGSASLPMTNGSFFAWPFVWVEP